MPRTTGVKWVGFEGMRAVWQRQDEQHSGPATRAGGLPAVARARPHARKRQPSSGTCCVCVAPTCVLCWRGRGLAVARQDWTSMFSWEGRGRGKRPSSPRRPATSRPRDRAAYSGEGQGNQSSTKACERKPPLLRHTGERARSACAPQPKDHDIRLLYRKPRADLT